MNVDTHFKNARHNADGTITADILHPVFGWIPFTASPIDVEAHGRSLFDHIKATGPVEPYTQPEGME